MNEQTLIVLVLLHFSPKFKLKFRLEYRIKDSVFTKWFKMLWGVISSSKNHLWSAKENE
jgi:hypothetical protein